MNIAVYEGLHIACKALGASAFLDRYEEKTKLGITQADKVFKKYIYDLISTHSTGIY